jgi:hypothetical protein
MKAIWNKIIDAPNSFIGYPEPGTAMTYIIIRIIVPLIPI